MPFRRPRIASLPSSRVLHRVILTPEAEAKYRDLRCSDEAALSPNCRSSSMSRSNPLLWPKGRVIWGYGIAILSVSSALIISRWPPLHLETAPVSLFLCAIMITALFGGVVPGLLATALSSLAFDYYFLF